MQLVFGSLHRHFERGWFGPRPRPPVRRRHSVFPRVLETPTPRPPPHEWRGVFERVSLLRHRVGRGNAVAKTDSCCRVEHPLVCFSRRRFSLSTTRACGTAAGEFVCPQALEAVGKWEPPPLGPPRSPNRHLGSDPARARPFAHALGRLAKTDAVDAAVPAEYAERIRPTPRPQPDADTARLQALGTVGGGCGCSCGGWRRSRPGDSAGRCEPADSSPSRGRTSNASPGFPRPSSMPASRPTPDSPPLPRTFHAGAGTGERGRG